MNQAEIGPWNVDLTVEPDPDNAGGGKCRFIFSRPRVRTAFFLPRFYQMKNGYSLQIKGVKRR